jgi:hypothetical protein
VSHPNVCIDTVVVISGASLVLSIILSVVLWSSHAGHALTYEGLYPLPNDVIMDESKRVFVNFCC